MRIRLLKDIETLKAGMVVYVNDEAGRQLIMSGNAMEDKSLEPKEMK